MADPPFTPGAHARRTSAPEFGPGLDGGLRRSTGPLWKGSWNGRARNSSAIGAPGSICCVICAGHAFGARKRATRNALSADSRLVGAPSFGHAGREDLPRCRRRPGRRRGVNRGRAALRQCCGPGTWRWLGCWSVAWWQWLIDGGDADGVYSVRLAHGRSGGVVG